MPNNIIPTKITEFNNYNEVVIPYFYANKDRLIISDARVIEMYTLWGVPYPTPPTLLTPAPSIPVPPPAPTPPPAGSWKDLFSKWENPDTKTTPVIHQLNTRKELMNEKYRIIYNDIPASLFTDEDYDITGKKKPDTTRTAAPVPTAAPAMEIDSMFHSHTTLRLRDPENPHTQKKPFGVHETEIEALVLNADGTVNEKKVETTGRFLYTMEFAEEHTGKKVRIRTRYKNTRGQGGPWSAYVDSVIG